jgi:hypothetical protein
MDRYLSCAEVKKLYNLQSFQLVELFPKGLQPYFPTGKKYFPPIKHHLITQLRSSLTELNDLQYCFMPEVTTEPGSVPEDSVDVEPLKELLKDTLASIKRIEEQDPRHESWEFFVRPSDQDEFRQILSEVENCFFERGDLLKFFPSSCLEFKHRSELSKGPFYLELSDTQLWDLVRFGRLIPFQRRSGSRLDYSKSWPDSPCLDQLSGDRDYIPLFPDPIHKKYELLCTLPVKIQTTVEALDRYVTDSEWEAHFKGERKRLAGKASESSLKDFEKSREEAVQELAELRAELENLKNAFSDLPSLYGEWRSTSGTTAIDHYIERLNHAHFRRDHIEAVRDMKHAYTGRARDLGCWAAWAKVDSVGDTHRNATPSMLQNSDFLTGREAARQLQIREAEFIIRVRRGMIPPYNPKSLEPVPTPTRCVKIGKYSPEEEQDAVLVENARRREIGSRSLPRSGGGSNYRPHILAPGTRSYDEFVNERCWHYKELESWEYLPERQEQHVLTWLYRKEDVRKLKEELAPPEPEFEVAFHQEELERKSKLEKEIREVEALMAPTPTEWEKKKRLLEDRIKEYGELKGMLGDLVHEDNFSAANNQDREPLADRVLPARNLSQFFPPQHEGSARDREEDAMLPSSGSALPFPCDPNTRWEDISFVLKSDDLIEVKTPRGIGRLVYNQVGFADKRSGDKPNKTTWPLFQVFAKYEGIISRSNPNYIRDLPDRARLLNKKLKEVFGINESIYIAHYRRHKKYQTRFRIRDDRAE